ncbi:DUF429 domain-containing protein [Thiorhodovibrio litoralis]|uniref:DUF429 domain-containing protein n=1 Tax=Thiorhodovibrio litoralis TaxID=2952932 RepID=UPI0019131B31|nr:DUF429 domain-containing protein [Thiorhodovibrio litoralis]
MIGSAKRAPIDVVADWLQKRSEPTLLALDAPLGWPAPLARALQSHAAGDAFDVEAHNLFRRETDRYIRRTIGKQSLDVGADRIARTAFAALELIAGLRKRTKREIPLAWTTEFSGIRVIEVYPAATLIAHGIDPSGYKAKNGESERVRVLDAIHALVTVDTEIPCLSYASDGLDAVICVLAACDFLSGLALSPDPGWPVKREGWVWFRDPNAQQVHAADARTSRG